MRKRSVGFLNHLLAMPLQRHDSWVRWMLVALAAIDIAATGAISGHPRLWFYAGFGIFALGALGFTGVVVLMSSAFSPAAVMLFLVTILAFNIWNFVVMVASVATGWWPLQGSQTVYPFVVTALIGVAPVGVGIGFLTRGLRLIPNRPHDEFRSR